MTRIFVFLTGFILVSGLSACGSSGGGETNAPTGGGSGGGNDDGSGDGGGDYREGGGGGDPQFATAFRILGMEDLNGVYTALEADRNTVFNNPSSRSPP